MTHLQVAQMHGVVERPADFWRQPQHAENYDAGRFDNFKGRFYRWREERAIERALRELSPGSTVLDAACGTGRVTALLSRKGFKATGCDISLPMMAVAHRRLTSLGFRVPLVESNVERLPYPDRSFDAVSCVGLLMHLDATARLRALTELARVSRGPLILQFGCVDRFQRLQERIRGRPAGGVRCAVSWREMFGDLERSGLHVYTASWVFRGLSSSVIVLAVRAPLVCRAGQPLI